MTHPIYLTFSCAAADAEGVATLQTTAGAGYFDIDGTYASGGVATLTSPARVTVESYSVDTSSLTFTITGTDPAGNALTEDIPGSTTTTTTTQTFATVTSVYVDGAVSGDTSIGTSDIGSTQWVPFDTYMPDFQVSFYLTLSAAGPIATVEVTFDDVFGTWRPAAVPFPRPVTPTSLSFEASANGVINDSIGPVTAARLTLDSTGVAADATITFVQQGY